MNTIILTLQTTSKTAEPVKYTGIAADKHQTSKPFFKQKIKICTFSVFKYLYGHFWKIPLLKGRSVLRLPKTLLNFKIKILAKEINVQW